jgi:hypothetical protein
MPVNPLLFAALLAWFLPIPGGYQTTPYSKPDIICWQEGYKLKFSDFQSDRRPTLPKEDSLPGHFLGATTIANAVVHDFKTESGKYVKTIVRVEFDKRKSWINKTYYFDRKATLIHEQLHFDIVELTGRKIRRFLAQQPDSFAPTVEAGIVRIYAQEDVMQRLCDKDTESGNNLKAQARWQESIKKQLDALRAYKSTPADCDPPQ